MTKTKFMGPEKRAYLRAPSCCAIKYAKLSKNLKSFINSVVKSHTEDICARGLKFVVRKKVPVHTILEFQFRIPGAGRNIAGLGEVVRVERRSSGKSYNVGLKFLWVQPKNSELIDAYVREKMIRKIVKKLRKK